MNLNCKFCGFEKGHKLIYENRYVSAFWGAPYVKGHVSVILKRHRENLTELSSAEYCALMEAWVVVGKVIEKVLRPDIINWQINCNWTRHIHGHIYPRWRSDKDWGEPISLPKHNQVKNKSYKTKDISDKDKARIEKLLKARIISKS